MPSDFAEAQKRIVARRLARENEARNAFEARRATGIKARISGLPGNFGFAGQGILDLWTIVSGRDGTRPAFRVGQVDAELLDEELLELLKGQVGEGLKYLGNNLKEEYTAEILLGLRAILFRQTLWASDATYGAALQGLVYTDARVQAPVPTPPSRLQKSLYGLITVGGRYAWQKWEDWLISQEAGPEEPTRQLQRLVRLTDYLSTAHSFTAFASFLVFLIQGRYRTLTDRLLRMRLIPKTSQVSREVSFEYLNRQLVWHAFTEFLLFILPLVGIGRLRRFLQRVWRQTKAVIRGDEGDEAKAKAGELAHLPERTCAICYQDQNPSSTSESDILTLSAAEGAGIGSANTDVTNPYEAVPCGDVYCYMCIAQRLDAEEGEGWVCLRCGDLVKQCKPWNGDVLVEEAPPAKSGKSVGFSEDTKHHEPKVSLSESVEGETASEGDSASERSVDMPPKS